MSAVVALKVHASRAEQIRRIANAHDLTITGTLERFIAREVEAGTIPPDLPGFDVSSYRDALDAPMMVIDLEGQLLPPVDPVMGKYLANEIDRLATTRGRDAMVTFAFDHDITLTIARKGQGVILKFADLAIGRQSFSTLSFSMAADLVRMIRRAADEAQANAQ